MIQEGIPLSLESVIIENREAVLLLLFKLTV